jgi:hypothetical protein
MQKRERLELQQSTMAIVFDEPAISDSDEDEPEAQKQLHADDEFSKRAFGSAKVVVTTTMGLDDVDDRDDAAEGHAMRSAPSDQRKQQQRGDSSAGGATSRPGRAKNRRNTGSKKHSGGKPAEGGKRGRSSSRGTGGKRSSSHGHGGRSEGAAAHSGDKRRRSTLRSKGR